MLKRLASVLGEGLAAAGVGSPLCLASLYLASMRLARVSTAFPWKLLLIRSEPRGISCGAARQGEDREQKSLQKLKISGKNLLMPGRALAKALKSAARGNLTTRGAGRQRMEVMRMASRSKWFMGAFPSDLLLALGEVQGSQCCFLPKVMLGVSPVEALVA